MAQALDARKEAVMAGFSFGVGAQASGALRGAAPSFGAPRGAVSPLSKPGFVARSSSSQFAHTTQRYHAPPVEPQLTQDHYPLPPLDGQQQQQQSMAAAGTNPSVPSVKQGSGQSSDGLDPSVEPAPPLEKHAITVDDLRLAVHRLPESVHTLFHGLHQLIDGRGAGADGKVRSTGFVDKMLKLIWPPASKTASPPTADAFFARVFDVFARRSGDQTGKVAEALDIIVGFTVLSGPHDGQGVCDVLFDCFHGSESHAAAALSHADILVLFEERLTFMSAFDDPSVTPYDKDAIKAEAKEEAEKMLAGYDNDHDDAITYEELTHWFDAPLREHEKCAKMVASTTIARASTAGSRMIEVCLGLKYGTYEGTRVILSSGTSTEEVLFVSKAVLNGSAPDMPWTADRGTLHLKTPLRFNHARGEVIVGAHPEHNAMVMRAIFDLHTGSTLRVVNAIFHADNGAGELSVRTCAASIIAALVPNECSASEQHQLVSMLQSICSALPPRRDGFIGADDLIAGFTLLTAPEETNAVCHEIFHMYDAHHHHHGGGLEREELVDFIRSRHIFETTLRDEPVKMDFADRDSPGNITISTAVDALMAKLENTTGSGRIEMGAFRTWFKTCAVSARDKHAATITDAHRGQLDALTRVVATKSQQQQSELVTADSTMSSRNVPSPLQQAMQDKQTTTCYERIKSTTMKMKMKTKMKTKTRARAKVWCVTNVSGRALPVLCGDPPGSETGAMIEEGATVQIEEEERFEAEDGTQFLLLYLSQGGRDATRPWTIAEACNGDGVATTLLIRRDEEDAWTPHVDEESGRWFFFNRTTKMSVWTPPKDMETLVDLWETWTPVFDTRASRVFYINRVTGAQTWETPPQVKASSTDRHTLSSSSLPPSSTVIFDTQQGAAEKSSRSAEKSTDSECWTTMADAENNTWYYFNTETHERVWFPPTEYLASLAAIWEPKRDSDSGMIFYTNKMTGESRWEPPLRSSLSTMMPAPNASEARALEIGERKRSETTHSALRISARLTPSLVFGDFELDKRVWGTELVVAVARVLAQTDGRELMKVSVAHASAGSSSHQRLPLSVGRYLIVALLDEDWILASYASGAGGVGMVPRAFVVTDRDEGGAPPTSVS